MASDIRVVRCGDRGVELARIRAPEPRAGEVSVAVAFAGICRTDLAVADGDIAVPLGRVLGHELSRRVGGLDDLGTANRKLAMMTLDDPVLDAQLDGREHPGAKAFALDRD